MRCVVGAARSAAATFCVDACEYRRRAGRTAVPGRVLAWYAAYFRIFCGRRRLSRQRRHAHTVVDADRLNSVGVGARSCVDFGTRGRARAWCERCSHCYACSARTCLCRWCVRVVASRTCGVCKASLGCDRAYCAYWSTNCGDRSGVQRDLRGVDAHHDAIRYAGIGGVGCWVSHRKFCVSVFGRTWRGCRSHCGAEPWRRPH